MICIRMPDSDLTIRSIDGQDFEIHRSIICFASAVIEGMLPRNLRSTTLFGNPIIQLPERGHVINTLIQFIYPTIPPKFTSLFNAAEVLEAVDCYEMYGVRAAIQDSLRLSQFPTTEPIALYILARNYRLDLVMSRVMKDFVSADFQRLPDNVLSSDIGRLRSDDYLRALSYARDRARKCLKILRDSKLHYKHICRCQTRAIEFDKSTGILHPKFQPTIQDYPCYAFLRFKTLAAEQLQREPIDFDIFKPSLRLSACEEEHYRCPDGLQNLMRNYSQYFTDLQRAVEAVGWEYPEGYKSQLYINLIKSPMDDDGEDFGL
ncbi:hypothetical protein SISSUDRAFT_1127398 [Sistotremastrum suecicum HHB10207 ss-3]|uniref:BTB domain-containing protein n=1 Tax=Sistotremastrum suecicum HHB10207 ss-3 TaxID=1314776 RepID=A0A166F3L7_9AGAM|nr:hypothetical protein SISSUDRAFT_1127398 [Sistotremastrum suecicum HHB10207 ss-3]